MYTNQLIWLSVFFLKTLQKPYWFQNVFRQTVKFLKIHKNNTHHCKLQEKKRGSRAELQKMLLKNNISRNPTCSLWVSHQLILQKFVPIAHGKFRYCYIYIHFFVSFQIKNFSFAIQIKVHKIKDFHSKFPEIISHHYIIVCVEKQTNNNCLT